MKITKQDLENEKKELDQRREALADLATKNGQFLSLGGEQQGYLFQQRDAMQRYSDALGERIRTWNDNTAAQLSQEATDAPVEQQRASRSRATAPADPNDGIREPAKGESHKDAQRSM